MRNAIILHGMPSKEEYFNAQSPSQSNKHWIPWVQRQLILHGILAQTPELPEPYDPDYTKWLEVFQQFHIDENTLLIGHSCGGGFLVRWLTENKIRVGKVVLVAPFIDPDRDEVKSDFFHFEIKPNLSENTTEMCIFYSTDDDREILDSVGQILAKDKAIKIKKFNDKGHFVLEHMRTKEFPELVKYLV